jgi:hypothetical protein
METVRKVTRLLAERPSEPSSPGEDQSPHKRMEIDIDAQPVRSRLVSRYSETSELYVEDNPTEKELIEHFEHQIINTLLEQGSVSHSVVLNFSADIAEDLHVSEELVRTSHETAWQRVEKLTQS